jgi:hypothetical protein
MRFIDRVQSKMSRILLLSDCPPKPGYGSGERTLSIHRALSRLATVEVLIVNPYRVHEGEHVVNLLDARSKATRWYWRKRNYFLQDFHADDKVATMVRKLHGRNNYQAFFGRYHLPFLGACQSRPQLRRSG